MALKLYYAVMSFLFVILMFIAFWLISFQKPINKSIEFEEIVEKSKKTESYSPPPKEFCGVSTYYECDNDMQCVESGCSGQICQSFFEKPVITTCEYRECYDYLKYSVSCKCYENKCQWVSID